MAKCKFNKLVFLNNFVYIIVEWKNEFRKGRLMKSMFRNVCYLIMSLLLIAAVIITIMDIANKYDELLYDAKAEYSKCL